MSQSEGKSGWHTFSDLAIEGWSRLCIDMGYELFGLAEPLALWSSQQSQS